MGVYDHEKRLIRTDVGNFKILKNTNPLNNSRLVLYICDPAGIAKSLYYSLLYSAIFH